MASTFPRPVLALDLASNRAAKLLRRLHSRYNPENSVSTGLQYDSTSGQVFTEVLFPAAPNLALRQHEEEAEQRARIFTGSPHGAASLYDTAMREVMANATGLTAEIWAAIPWHIGKRIWEEAEALDLPRLSIWKAYMTAYGYDVFDGDEQHAYFRASEIRPQFPLEERLGHLESPTMAFITCLTISSTAFSRSDIVNISKLRNLGALDVSVREHSAGLVDDSVIRNWGRRASDQCSQSFPQLRVLLLRNQPGVTVQSFQHLHNLPALVLFGVLGCRITAKDQRVAVQSGWTQEDEHGLIAELQHDIDVGKTWDAPIRHCYEHSTRLAAPDVSDHQAAEGSSQAKKKKPLLNFRVGPTPSEVLYSMTHSLVFFRSTNPAARRSNDCMDHHVKSGQEPATGSKKRKLRESRQIAAEDILDGL